MKILILNTLYYPNIVGGAEVSTRLIAEQLVENGHEVSMISTSNYEEVRIINGVKCFYLHHSNIYWAGGNKKHLILTKAIWHQWDNMNIKMLDKINNIVKKESPDTIHTNNLTGLSLYIWKIARRLSIPVVHTLRDYSLICAQGTMYKENKNCETRCSSCALFTQAKKKRTNTEKISHLVGLSKSIIDTHKNNGYFEGVPSEVIFNGIKAESDYDTGLGYTSLNKPLNFLYMGRIEKSKGIHVLLKTFRDIPNANLLIAGKLNDEINPSTYPTNIKFLGFMDSDKAIKSADVVIIPSLWNEPFGRVVIEAYKHNKPVIASDRGGLSEIVENNLTGYVYNSSNIEELKEIIKLLIVNSDNIIRLSDNIKDYKKQFEIRKITSKYEIIYNKISESQNT